MAESPMVGARVPQAWQEKIQQLAQLSGRREADIVREALGQYLGQVDVMTVKGAIANLESRVAMLESKLAGLGRLVG
jgi:RHH-type rel operon transcriptional repressor/antitoxin RelB